MKAAFVAFALLSSCVFAAHAGHARQLLQAVAPASPDECVGQPTVFDVAESAGLTTFVEALMLDELESSLDNTTGYPLQYTVFAPTNEAIDSLLSEMGTTLEDLRDNGMLDDVLQYHFLITPYTAEQLLQVGTVGTNFRNQTIDISPEGVITAYGSNATIVQGQSDIQACQTIVHVIDGVLVPNFDAVAPPTGAPMEASS